jgi:hypothetical protein
VRLHGGHELEDLRAAVEIDLGYLADEVVALQELDGSEDYPAGAEIFEGVQQALDDVRAPADIGPICTKIAEGRLLMARARAHAEHRPRPSSATPCFFDPGHGPADHFVAWTPKDKEPRTVPACGADAAVVEQGLDPEPRLVTHDSHAIAFWAAPNHFAYWFQGYFGHTGECFPVRLLEGFPLAGEFAEPSSDDGVITSDEVFTPHHRR